MLTSEDLLIVDNHGDTDATFRYAGRDTVVPAGAAKQVPFDAVRVALGDPRSLESPTVAVQPNGDRIHIPSRAQEIQRLENQWGLSTRRVLATQAGKPLTDTLADVTPQVSITTVDGQTVDTPVSDPTGTNPVGMPVDLNSPDAMKAQLAELQRKMDAVQAGLRQAESVPDQESGEVGEDKPPVG